MLIRPLLKRISIAIFSIALLLAGAAFVLNYAFGINIFSEGFKIEEASFSPDGRTILISFKRRGEFAELAEYDISKKTLSVLPMPSYYHWGEASYSPDGKKITAIFRCMFDCNNADGLLTQVVIIDRRTYSYEVLTNGEKNSRAPKFSPDMKFIYYVRVNNYEKWNNWSKKWEKIVTGFNLVRITVSDGTKEDLYPSKDNFGARKFSSATFRSLSTTGTLVHIADPDENEPIFKAARERGLKQVWMAAILNDDGHLSLLPNNRKNSGLNFSASPVTGEIAYVRDNGIMDSSNRRSHKYDIYLDKGDQISRITNLDTDISFLHISHDGRRILFFVDEAKENQRQIWYYDRSQKKSIKTNIRALIGNLPMF
jgi:hypothetical protein